MQDTPDNSSNFHYGTCRIPKHPLGIVKICENLNLTCSIYNHMETLEKPIISRHGTKGGRFIDAMYTCSAGLEKITGITIISDAGINSDHAMIINKIDLGIQNFKISTKKEERIDFKRIMNIPVKLKKGDLHPTLNDQVYKGTEFARHAALFYDMEKIIEDPANGYMERIKSIHQDLERMESDVINRTKTQITVEDQKSGKLINRTADDANILNDASAQLFRLINDICRQAGLASMVAEIPSSLIIKNRTKALTGKNMLATTSFPISKQIDDALKKARNIAQRLGILLRFLTTHWHNHKHSHEEGPTMNKKMIRRIPLNIKRLCNQHNPFINSVSMLISICIEIKDERIRHIEAIEYARNKKFYDSNTKYIDSVINNQGRDEYNNFIDEIKREVFEHNSGASDAQHTDKTSCKLTILSTQCEKWKQIIDEMPDYKHTLPTAEVCKTWYTVSKRAKRHIKNVIRTLQHVRQQEWINSKNYLINIGKFGSIAHMINPKNRSGPTALYISRHADDRVLR